MKQSFQHPQSVCVCGWEKKHHQVWESFAVTLLRASQPHRRLKFCVFLLKSWVSVKCRFLDRCSGKVQEKCLWFDFWCPGEAHCQCLWLKSQTECYCHRILLLLKTTAAPTFYFLCSSSINAFKYLALFLPLIQQHVNAAQICNDSQWSTPWDSSAFYLLTWDSNVSHAEQTTVSSAPGWRPCTLHLFFIITGNYTQGGYTQKGITRYVCLYNVQHPSYCLNV